MAKSVPTKRPSQIVSEMATFMHLMEKDGLPNYAYQVAIGDPKMRRLLIQYWKARCPPLIQGAEATVTTGPFPPRKGFRYLGGVVHERHIGRSAVHDARQVNTLLSLGYTEGQLTAFGPPPDSLPGFLTFFDPGWDILRLCQHCNMNKWDIFRKQNWYNKEEFANKHEEPRYRQIGTEGMVMSYDKDFEEQKALVPGMMEIPLARRVVMGMVVHFLHAKMRLFPTYYVRCDDKDSGGGRVCVGDFDWDLDISGLWPDSFARRNIQVTVEKSLAS